MKHVGLEISNRSVRFIEFKSDRCGHIPFRYDEVKLPAGVIVNGEILEKEEFRKILSAFNKKNKLSFARVSIPEDKAYIFITDIPFVEDSMVADSVAFRIEENVPMSAYETLFDYEIIKKDPLAKKISVVVSVIPKKIIHDYLDVLLSCGIKPLSFKIESWATAKSIVKKTDKKTQVIVNVKESKTVLSIVSNNIPLFSAVVYLGEESIRKSLKKVFPNVDENSPVDVNGELIPSNTANNDAFNTLLNDFTIIKDEINKLFIYWYTHKSNEEEKLKINEIILIGKATLISGFSEYIANNLKTKVRFANVWVNCFSLDKVVPNIEFEDSLKYATAVGLAISK
ncbi:MAG: pilus assembly protein PilM [Chitinophagaceae bacterium]|nr:pilus assembly protein PilM [Chitinophagaceae bacterium]